MSELRAPAEGATFAFSSRIEVADIDTFAALSGDRHPLHMDADYARARGFRDRVAHGALLGGLVSRLVGMHLPAEEVMLLGLTLHFAAPTHPGDELLLQAEVVSVHPAASALNLRFTITCEGELRARGTAMVRAALGAEAPAAAGSEPA